MLIAMDKHAVSVPFIGFWSICGYCSSQITLAQAQSKHLWFAGIPKDRGIFEKLCLLEVERGSMSEVENAYALEMKFRVLKCEFG